MLGERYIGAFIQNTLKPLIEELDNLLGKCEHLKLDKEDLKALSAWLIDLEIKKTIFYCVTYIILGVLFCLTVYFILK